MKLGNKYNRQEKKALTNKNWDSVIRKKSTTKRNDTTTKTTKIKDWK